MTALFATFFVADDREFHMKTGNPEGYPASAVGKVYVIKPLPARLIEMLRGIGHDGPAGTDGDSSS